MYLLYACKKKLSWQFLQLALTLGFGSSGGIHLLRNGLAAGGFSNASVALTGGLIIEFQAFQYLIFQLFCFILASLLVYQMLYQWLLIYHFIFSLLGLFAMGVADKMSGAYV